MEEQQTAVTPGTQTPGGASAAGGETPAEKTFTQQELDRIIAERLKRQRDAFGDVEAMKTKAAEYDKLQEAAKTEQQKITERLQALERERDQALQKAHDRLIRSAFLAEAARAGVAHPEDVFALADRSGVALDEADNVTGVAEAVKAVVEAGRVPLVNSGGQRPPAPRLDAGTGGGQRPGEQKTQELTEEELAIARRMGVSPEKYAEQKAAMRRNRG